MLEVKKLYKSYGSLSVLSDVTFTLARGQKAALVGYNGTGKTTLMKIAAGLESPDAGDVIIAPDACIGYLPQDTSLVSDESISDYLRRIAGIDVLEREMSELIGSLEDPAKTERYATALEKFERLNGYAFEHRMEVMLAGFGLGNVVLAHRLSDLSSGQKSKVALAGILLKGVDLLLLDEPTNNLDLPALIWLEDFLQSSGAACLIISHDRRFLDRVVRKIFELDWSTHSLTISGGTYSDYLEMQAKRTRRHAEDYLLQQEEIERLEKEARAKRAQATSGARWRGTDNDKFLRGFKRDRAAGSARVAKALERRIEQMEKIEKPVEREPLTIPLISDQNNGSLDLRIEKLIAGYPGGFSIGPITLDLRYGNRVGIMGLNGSGKSTLVKTISGVLPPLAGKVQLGSGIRIGNMLQEHESLLRESTPLEFLLEHTGTDLQRARAILARFGFEDQHVTSPIGILSPGARARLLIADFAARSVNMLILDEPTNHLDSEALEALEETLESYEGTVVLISHDRYFLEKSKLDFTYVLSDGSFERIPDYRTYVSEAEERAKKLLKSL